jgi:ketosteroid isomerase-like protein
MDTGRAASRWADTWAAGWRAHDVEPILALYADGCLHRSTPFRPPHRGRDGVRDYVVGAFEEERSVEEVRDYWHEQPGHHPPPDDWGG